MELQKQLSEGRKMLLKSLVKVLTGFWIMICKNESVFVAIMTYKNSAYYNIQLEGLLLLSLSITGIIITVILFDYIDNPLIR